MRVVTIKDTRGGMLAFDLFQVLRLLEPELARTAWALSGVEATGEGAEELHRLADGGARVSGPKLLALAACVVQIVEGEFTGYNPGLQRPWVTIRAFDSSGYDVASPDNSVIDRVKAHFSSVVEIPGDHYFGSAQ